MIVGLPKVRLNNTRSPAIILVHPAESTAGGRSSSVATEQKISTLDIERESADSAIPNELPTYRAISTRAIISVICGVMASFTFAHPFFYVAAVSAVVLGFLAHRTIQRYPDMFTGKGLANAGIALGLIFGLTSGTYTVVQTYVRTRQAEKFAKQYAEILESPTLANVLLYSMHPDGRLTESGEDLVKKLESASPKEKMSIDQKFGQTIALKKRLQSSKDEHVEFVRIESVGEDEGNGREIPIYALALYELNGPGSKEFPAKQQYAMAVLKGRLKGKQYEWWVDDIRFPYTPKTFVPTVKAPDDGHGHAH
jgi:Domain of unknown function (DUF4190)